MPPTLAADACRRLSRVLADLCRRLLLAKRLPQRPRPALSCAYACRRHLATLAAHLLPPTLAADACQPSLPLADACRSSPLMITKRQFSEPMVAAAPCRQQLSNACCQHPQPTRAAYVCRRCLSTLANKHLALTLAAGACRPLPLADDACQCLPTLAADTCQPLLLAKRFPLVLADAC